MRAVLAALALVALVALLSDLSPRKMFAPVPAANMPTAASVPYAYTSPYAQPAAFSAKHRVPMFPLQPTGEARIATLALMPGNGEIPEVKPPKPQPKITIYWGRILSTALLFAAIGYVGSTYDSQSTDTSILSTVGKWLSDPPFREVPEEHLDVLGIPMGRQTRTEVNYGSLFLMGSIVPARVLMSKAVPKAQEFFQQVFFGKKDLKSFLEWRTSLEKNVGKRGPQKPEEQEQEPLEQMESGTADDAEVGAEAIWGNVSPENRQERHFD